MARNKIYETPMTAKEKQSRARTRGFQELTSKSMDASKLSTSNLISLMPQFFSKKSNLDTDTRKYFLKKIISELNSRVDLL